MDKHSISSSSWAQKDQKLEKKLRPVSLGEFIGQSQVRERLEVTIGAAKKRQEPLGHHLFYGPPGLGKTTLAFIISKELGTNLLVTSGPSLEKPADLVGILTNLKKGDVLFIDEVHRLSRPIEEYLYSAIEDFSIDVLLDSGPHARTVRVKLEKFTLVGATTQLGLLSQPLLSRFALTNRLDYYSPEVLSEILRRSSSILTVEVDQSSLMEIAIRSRGTPRTANNLLKWVRDYAQMRTNSCLDKLSTRSALEMLDIDYRGLNEIDKRLLEHIIKQHQGGPVGITTIAAAIGEEPSSLREVNEPFLIMQGLLKRTPRGREATPLAFQHLGHPHKPKQGG